MSWPHQWTHPHVPPPVQHGPPPPLVSPLINPAQPPPPINAAAAVAHAQYATPEQWSQLQNHQNQWNQWAQWQQQYQQWQQQYGAEYQTSLNSGAVGGGLVQPAAVVLPSPLHTPIMVQPPLPVDAPNPPLPKEPPPPPPPQPMAPPQSPLPPLPVTAPSNNVVGVAVHNNLKATSLLGQYSSSPASLNRLQPPPKNLQPSTNQLNQFNSTASFQQAPPLIQTATVTVAPNPYIGSQTVAPPFEQPSKPVAPPEETASAQFAAATISVSNATAVPTASARPLLNADELSEAEKKFDRQFAEWEAQFSQWKEQNSEHPDKEQYKEYEKRWEQWRSQLLERREQMRKKRLEAQKTQMVAAQPSPTRISTNSSNCIKVLSEIQIMAATPNVQSSPIATATASPFSKPPPTFNTESSSSINQSSLNQFTIDNSHNVCEQQNGTDFLKPNKNSCQFQSEIGPPDMVTTPASISIPGLDLVKPGDEEVLAEYSSESDGVAEQPVSKLVRKGPDFEALSKGINTILSDEKLMSLLSMVSQNKLPTTTKTTTVPDQVSFSSESTNISNDHQVDCLQNCDINTMDSNVDSQEERSQLPNNDNNSVDGGAEVVGSSPAQNTVFNRRTPADLRPDAIDMPNNFSSPPSSFEQTSPPIDDGGSPISLIPAVSEVLPSAANRKRPASRWAICNQQNYTIYNQSAAIIKGYNRKPPPNNDSAQLTMWKPVKIVEYEHKPRKPKPPEPDVLIDPSHMFDYRHTPLSRIPLPQRPKWLLDAVRNITEFDPPIMRPYENLRRYRQQPASAPPPPSPPPQFRDGAPTQMDFPSRGFYHRNEYKSGGSDQMFHPSGDGRHYKGYPEQQQPLVGGSFSTDHSRYGEEYPRSTVSHSHPLNRLYPIEKYSSPAPQRTVAVAQPEQTVRSAMESASLRTCPILNKVVVEELLDAPGRYQRPSRIVIILRGPPGSGKTHLARQIKDKEVECGGSAPRILSLDDYFMVEQEKVITEADGKQTKTKEMIYEYESEMEDSYRQSLLRAFRKTITDGYFSFIIVDDVNDKVRHYAEMWTFAKHNGFQVYVCQLELNVQVCAKRNVHHRSEMDIERLVKCWEPTPTYHHTVDVSSMLEAINNTISDVEMEEVISSDEEIPCNNDSMDDDNRTQDPITSSKWDRFDCTVDNLAKLDGVYKPFRSSTKSMADYLRIDDDTEWSPVKPIVPGKKRVRWADLEKEREQKKMRALGFVVGQTDWTRLMDPMAASSALTQTKYIEKIARY